MVTTRNQAQNPTHGTKVTDPSASTINEAAGPVASDSLAAESSNAGGKFSENRDSAPQSVSGSNSTFANTDTSAATRLDPARDAESRDADTPTYPNSSTPGSNENSSAETAPSYVNSQYVDGSGPKGKNLTEIDSVERFEGGEGKNASFNGDVGGRNDPGRLAEKKFQSQNARGNDAGMPRQEGDVGENSFEALGGETSA